MLFLLFVVLGTPVFADTCSDKDDIVDFIICNDPELKKQEKYINSTFVEKVNAASKEDSFDILEQLWLFEKEIQIQKCKTKDCLKEAYRKRKEKLTTIVAMTSAVKKESSKFENLPDDYEVYVIYSYDFTEKVEDIILGEDETNRTDVWVNRPGKNVVLVLSTYEPAIWDIKTTKNTNIIGVTAKGYYPQMVRGVPETTQVLLNKGGNISEESEMPGVLKSLGLYSENATYMGETITIGKGIDAGNYIFERENVFGEAITEGLLPGGHGIKQLLQEGKLAQSIPAVENGTLTDTDIEVIPYESLNPYDEGVGYRKLRDLPLYIRREHLIMTMQFETLPQGSSGAHAITLLVPKDLRPAENPEHSRIFLMNKTREELGFPVDPMEKEGGCQSLQRLNEISVCLNERLSDLKDRFDRQFDQEIEKAGKNKNELESDKIEWMSEKERCTTISCIVRQYERKLKWLEAGNARKLYEAKPLPESCFLPEFREEYEIHVMTSYEGGRKTDVNLSALEVTGEHDIRINRPGKNVFLYLSSHEPAVWNLHITEGTKVIGVIADGYERQMVRGAPKEAFVALHDAFGGETCGIGYADKKEIRGAVRDLGLLNETYKQIMEDRIGNRVSDASYQFDSESVQGVALKLALPPGSAGVEQLVKEGKLKKLSAKDFCEKYGEMKVSGNTSILEELRNVSDLQLCSYRGIDRTYIMMEQFETLPEALWGDRAIELLIPSGLHKPQNKSQNPWRSHIMKLEKGLSDITVE